MMEQREINRQIQDKEELEFESIANFGMYILDRLADVYANEISGKEKDFDFRIDSLIYSINKILYIDLKDYQINIYQQDKRANIVLNSEMHLLEKLSNLENEALSMKLLNSYFTRIDRYSKRLELYLKKLTHKKFINPFKFYANSEISYLFIEGVDREKIKLLENKIETLSLELKDSIKKGDLLISNTYISLIFRFKETEFFVNFY